MVLNTPKINGIGVFDANYPYTFSILYEGEQAVRNRAVIRDNTTYDIIYDKTQDGLRLNHIIEADTLENNKTYSIQIQVFDVQGNSSNLSDVVIFNCYTTPLFYFSNVNAGNTIASANLSTGITFSQGEGDSLKEYKYYLYDANRSQLYSSNSFYTLSDTAHTYYGLSNMTNYFIRAVGKTVYGFNVDTGYVQISVKYNCIPTNIAVQAQNKDGRIILNANIVSTDYDLENDSYILENGELTLTDNIIKYHVKDLDDFSLIVKARNLPPEKPFIDIFSEQGHMSAMITAISGKYYCKLNTQNNSSRNIIYQPILGPLIGDTAGNAVSTTENELIRTVTNVYDKTALIVFEIQRSNHLYSLETYYQ